MKGLIVRALSAGACCAAALTGVGCGGGSYRDVVDPCWPERYNYVAHKEVNEAMLPQQQNGHILDQTVGNEFFEMGTDKLTVGGQEKLKYLARRRPAPDLTVYLSTAEDVTYDSAKPEEYTSKRGELNAKRTMAVQGFLGAYSGGAQSYNVVVHDPGDRSQLAAGAQRAVVAKEASFQGVLTNFVTLGGGR